MLKAGALYFAIVMAFFIAIITASLIMLAAHFRTSYLKEVRYARLLNNLNSGIGYVLADQDTSKPKLAVDLFKNQSDSVLLERKNWGVYNLAVVKSHILGDTISKVFFTGIKTDKDPDVLYLSDEDRPLSVSGNTRLTGDAALPKAGIKQSYAEGKPYTGDKKLIDGKNTSSKRTLKGLNSNMVKEIQARFKPAVKPLQVLNVSKLSVSFKDSTRTFKLLPGSKIDSELEGNIILVSDTSVTISATAKLNHIQIYAHSVAVESGFKGNCQIFARDSVVVGENVRFDYPSVVGVLRTIGTANQPSVTFGKGLQFNGIVFTYEEKRSAMQTLISLSKESHLNGEVYSTGLIKVQKGVSIAGKVSCNRFIMQTPVTLYENFLIDVVFNRKARSKYYLSAGLFEGQAKEKEVLQWLR
ncbi:hypothetical protein [Pedobacter cryoconitis]|uniref:Cytoskeletal protein CcmA (Bactofilin family) n=1 Tax=Pedobacter cryoconitis TaxID=188932 RepID=A0A7X0J7Q9_9SPHI|nr:hypothetical protein [Pedobacter cryoconitis]MBB6502649.1 cytoskeletal protein CcmA (bactofilin family) [Pedobacter cryoconitis]